jgi:farnesyl-diphosphate farnesyltransferase
MKMGNGDGLLKSVSRSFYLSMRFLPVPMREPISLGYLLARFSDTIADAPELPDEMRLALLDEFRLVIQGQTAGLSGDLTKISEQLDHPGERHLLRSADDLFAWYGSLGGVLRDHLSEVILTIIHGQSWDIQAFQHGNHAACEGKDDLLRYTYWVAGSVGEFWTKTGFTTLGKKFSHPDNATAMLMSGRKLGQALQLVNILRDLHEDLPRGRCYLPKDELIAVGWDGATALTAAELTPVFSKWLGVCHGFLEESDSYVRAVRDPRVRFCTRLPKLLAADTVDLLRDAGVDRAMVEKIKISRTDVWKAMGRAIFF